MLPRIIDSHFYRVSILFSTNCAGYWGFYISPTPVRTATLQLNHDGLVHLTPNNRAAVLLFTPYE